MILNFSEFKQSFLGFEVIFVERLKKTGYETSLY